MPLQESTLQESSSFFSFLFLFTDKLRNPSSSLNSQMGFMNVLKFSAACFDILAWYVVHAFSRHWKFLENEVEFSVWGQTWDFLWFLPVGFIYFLWITHILVNRLLVICLDFYLQASMCTGLSSVSLGLTPQDMMIHLLFSCSTNSSVTFIVLGNWKGKGLFFIIVIIINIISVLHRCASIRAIETNSISDFRKLVAYWVLFSLISLFDHAFSKLLEW